MIPNRVMEFGRRADLGGIDREGFAEKVTFNRLEGGEGVSREESGGRTEGTNSAEILRQDSHIQGTAERLVWLWNKVHEGQDNRDEVGGHRAPGGTGPAGHCRDFGFPGVNRELLQGFSLRNGIV